MIVRFEFKLTPLMLLRVKLIRAVTLLGMNTALEEPPKTREDVIDRLAAVPAIAGPSSSRVFTPTENTPLVRVSVPAMVRLEFKLTPFVLLIVRLLRAVTLLGIVTELEEPPKTRLEADVVDRLVGVPAIAGPSSSRVFAPTESVPLVRVSVLVTLAFWLRVTPVELLIVRLLTVVGIYVPVT